MTSTAIRTPPNVFSKIDGRTVTADLTDRNYRAAAKIVQQYNTYLAQMRAEHPVIELLHRHLEAADRVVKGSAKSRARSGKKTEDTAIRVWALAHGIAVAPRGRISKDVYAAYYESSAPAALPKRKPTTKAAKAGSPVVTRTVVVDRFPGTTAERKDALGQVRAFCLANSIDPSTLTLGRLTTGMHDAFSENRPDDLRALLEA
jgi:hypothetical protein